MYLCTKSTLMQFLLVFIPVLMAMALALRDQYERKNLAGSILLSVTSLLVLLRFSVLAYFFADGERSMFLNAMEQFSSLYIMPFTYMFLCDQCGSRWNNRSAIFMLCLPALSLLSLTPSLEHIAMRDWIVIAQCITIGFCLIRLWKRIRERHLEFTRQIKIYFVWMAFLLLFTILSFAIGMDRSFGEGTHWSFFIYYTLVIASGYLTIPYSFKLQSNAQVQEEKPTEMEEETPPAEEAQPTAIEEEVLPAAIEEEALPTAKEEEAPLAEQPPVENAVEESIALEKEDKAEENYHQEEEADNEQDSFSRLNEHLAEAMHKMMEEDLYYLNQNINIDDVAHKLGTNRTYVTRLMRQEYGLSFIEYVNVARIQYSQKILYTSPNITLEEVATKAGFQSTSNYCRAFKRYTGTTPKGWLQTLS